MLNVHSSLFALRALVKPGLIVPGIKVDTIARLDFGALKQAGFTGAVFDRDNCLTIPHQDTVVPDIADAWTRCKSTFGANNVLVVSNSAGTRDDPLGIQAESVCFHLGVPVLRHSRKKPVCGDEILAHFLRRPTPASPQPQPQAHPADSPSLNDPINPTLASITFVPTQHPPIPDPPPNPRLLVIGDRLLTDILLSNTLSHTHLGIWTTHLWSKPDLPLIRYLERSLLRLVLWSRNQTFRDGVLERRTRGENWLGQEGWISWTRRRILGVIRRERVEREPIPPRTNDLARFVLPLRSATLPITRAGWAWYYSKIVGRYAISAVWTGAIWVGMYVLRGGRKAWVWAITKVKEKRAVQQAAHQNST